MVSLTGLIGSWCLMPSAYYFNDDDLERLQKVADNIHSEPHKREYFNTMPGGMTLQEIGDEIGVSQERVRQIINNALAKLRRNAIGSG